MARATNALRKTLAGLRLHGENVSPEVPNDLFRAHESIYHFASAFAQGRRVLDLGCGSGYGASILQAGGASSVIAVDADPKNIAYARTRFETDSVRFRLCDAGELVLDRPVDLIVASNMLEHLVDTPAVIERLTRFLSPGGVLVAAVPPITDENSLRENQRNPFHRTNLYVGEWMDLFRRHFGSVRLFAHDLPAAGVLDFNSPFASKVDPKTFRFPETDLDTFPATQSLTAVFVAEQPHGS